MLPRPTQAALCREGIYPKGIQKHKLNDKTDPNETSTLAESSRQTPACPHLLKTNSTLNTQKIISLHVLLQKTSTRGTISTNFSLSTPPETATSHYHCCDQAIRTEFFCQLPATSLRVYPPATSPVKALAISSCHVEKTFDCQRKKKLSNRRKGDAASTIR